MSIFKVDIQIPLFRDERTPEFQEASLEESSSPPTIHMDAMAFGMGCCCLQVTFQVCLSWTFVLLLLLLLLLDGLLLSAGHVSGVFIVDVRDVVVVVVVLFDQRA